MIILPQPWCLGLWAGPTLWGTFVLACSLSQEKIRNYHPGSICFPGSLNLPIWSVCHPNAWWVSCQPRMSPCHPASGKGPSKENVLGCLCHLRAASHLNPLIFLWQAEKDLFRHGGREKERDEQTLGMWAGSSKTQKEGLLTLDRGLCFDFATINQEWCFGSSLWSFGMSLLFFQRQYQARKLIRRDNLWGYSHLHRHLALLTYPAPAKKYHGSWNHVGWKGSLEVIQSQLPAQGRIRLLRAHPAAFGVSPGREIA